MKSIRSSTFAVAFVASAASLAAIAHAQVETPHYIEISHAQGKTDVQVPPGKVLVQDWAIFDNLVALGISVAGVPVSNAPGYLNAEIPADALQLGSLFEPDFETIAASASEADVYFIGGRSRSAYETARDLVPTIDMTVDNGNIVAGVKNNLDLLGSIFDVYDKAAELTTMLEDKVAAVKAAAEGKGTALVLITNAGKLGVYGPDSRVSWIHNEVGMLSALDSVKDGDHGGDAISFEFLLEVNPDWVFVVDRDAGIGEDTAAAAALLDNELFNQTTAAREGQVVYLDSQAAYISMHGYQGLMLMLDQVLTAFNN